jgi:hypothetical protein
MINITAMRCKCLEFVSDGISNKETGLPAGI